jgi:hypothetical protein
LRSTPRTQQNHFKSFKIRAPRLAEQEEDRERGRELDPL